MTTKSAYVLTAAAAKQERRAADVPAAKAVQLLVAAMAARLQAVDYERRAAVAR